MFEVDDDIVSSQPIRVPDNVIDSQAVQLFSEVSGFKHFLVQSSSSKIETCCTLNRMHVVKSCVIEGFEFKGFPLSFKEVGVCHSAMFVCLYVL